MGLLNLVVGICFFSYIERINNQCVIVIYKQCSNTLFLHFVSLGQVFIVLMVFYKYKKLVIFLYSKLCVE